MVRCQLDRTISRKYGGDMRKWLQNSVQVNKAEPVGGCWHDRDGFKFCHGNASQYEVILNIPVVLSIEMGDMTACEWTVPSLISLYASNPAAFAAQCDSHDPASPNLEDRPSVDEIPCYRHTRKFSPYLWTRGHRAAARDLVPMALYYDYYDEYGDVLPPPDHSELTYDAEQFYDDHTAYDVAAAEYYDLGDGYAYAATHPEVQYDTFRSEEGLDYEESEELDDGCMQIAYGEPGYWEEYQRRRYEIIYGVDSVEEEESPPPSEGEGDWDDGGAAIEDDEASEWAAAWERGPRLDENELVWAEAMKAWRQTIELDAADSAVDFKPKRALSSLRAASLTRLYDRGDIADSDREECARILRELWACELEDQRLLAAGYVWDEEMGEYVHPVETDTPVEYDADEGDFEIAHLTVHKKARC
ncbi:hypothetical protein B0H14DRAFT_2591148 [Mycena olivaceomarginata]|nr:hypothetical protein B0H14DRAFT_2591148 [Mycena olivaceomarginata]